MSTRLSILVALFLVGMVSVSLAVFHISYRANLDASTAVGNSRISQASERLLGQLTSNRVMVDTLARHPLVSRALRVEQGDEKVEELLQKYVLTYGAERIDLVTRDGSVLVSSTRGTSPTIEPQDRALLIAALNGRMGLRHGRIGENRFFRFSRGVIVNRPPAQGAIIVTTSVAAIEFEWSVGPETIGFFDRSGVIFVANRSSLLLQHVGEPGPVPEGYDPIPVTQRRSVADHQIWDFADTADLPETGLVLSEYVPRLDMTVIGFLDVAPARSVALIYALLAAASVALLGLAALFVELWRSRLADRLAVEEKANSTLEARVNERTAELHLAQHQLVQASKLTALGQMSAGISHELNQPLAAIMNFAENGERLIDRSRPQDARGNLQQIAQQVQRMDRIIRNLRAFARNEDETVTPVDLVAVCTDAVSLLQGALDNAGVRLEQNMPVGPFLVMGGQVRLQQVVVNLLHNAMDAMSNQDDARIILTLTSAPTTARLCVRDNGPGLADASRVFEPFYTTKELGASKGLGLGLAISYGIIGSFGGEIMCSNHTEGGAVFTITLPRAIEAAA